MTDRLIYKREEGLFKRRHDRSFRNDSRASRRRDFSYTQRFDTLQMRRHVVAVFIVFSSFPFFFFFFFVSSLFSCFLILTRHTLLIDYRLSLFMRVKLLAQKYRILHFLADSEVGSGSSGVALKGLDDKSLRQIRCKALSATSRLKGSRGQNATPRARIIIIRSHSGPPRF